jgi:hypothetical protein
MHSAGSSYEDYVQLFLSRIQIRLASRSPTSRQSRRLSCAFNRWMPVRNRHLGWTILEALRPERSQQLPGLRARCKSS